MLAPITNILPQTIVQRLRMLPHPGQVQVRQGQQVRATDVIASTTIHPKHLMLDAASGLGVSRSMAGHYIERYEQEKVAEGDVIARKAGLFSRVVRTPVAGRIVLITDGYVFIEEDQPPFELLAGIPGEVTELVHEMGAVIETVGALVQGAWGNGKIDFGVLRVGAEKPDDVLQPEAVDVGQRGSVLLGGRCHSLDVFRRASEQRLRGLILSSMPSELIPAVRKLPLPVLLTEGFGDQPMNPAIFRLLSTSDRRDIAVNAEPFDRDTGARPEVLIPLAPAPDISPAPQAGQLEVGRQVRVTRAPHRGLMGTVDAIPPGRTVFSNGLRLPAVRIRTESGENLLVPLANVEIVNVRS